MAKNAQLQSRGQGPRVNGSPGPLAELKRPEPGQEPVRYPLREKAVELARSGMTNREIADNLERSVPWVVTTLRLTGFRRLPKGSNRRKVTDPHAILIAWLKSRTDEELARRLLVSVATVKIYRAECGLPAKAPKTCRIPDSVFLHYHKEFDGDTIKMARLFEMDHKKVKERCKRKGLPIKPHAREDHLPDSAYRAARDSGMTVAQIAAEYNRHPRTVKKALRRIHQEGVNQGRAES